MKLNVYELQENSYSHIKSSQNVFNMYVKEDIINWASDVTDYDGNDVEKAIELLAENGEYLELVKQ